MTQATDTTPGAYTIPELAQRLAVSPKTIWKWHYTGRLPGVLRAGRCVRYDRATIERRLLSGELLLPVNGR